MIPTVRVLILIAITLVNVRAVSAADFTFFATLRAGQSGNAGWEMGLGTNAAADQSTGQFRWSNASPFWRPGGQPQNFEIRWQSATQTASVTVWDSGNTPWTRQLVNTGPAVGVNTIWTFPAAGFFAQAVTTGRPSSITISNLAIAPGVQILSGSLPSSIGASQPPASSASMNAPLVINPASTGGDWYLSGNIRFAGLAIGSGTGARNSDLQFFLQAAGSETPESSTVLLTAGGLLVVIGWHRRRRPDAV
jgi:hypothetical protein